MRPRTKPWSLPVALGSAMVLLAMAGPAVAKTVQVTFSHEWPGGTDRVQLAFQRVFAEFEKRNPDIKVKIMPGMSYEKLLTSLAAGIAPDVSQVYERVSTYAIRGLMLPLDDLIKSSKVSADDFFAPSWRECMWDGKIWALSWGSDPNFGLLWNKDMFREVGLDPESPPETIAALNAMTPKLEKRDASGVLKRAALVPWDTGYFYGNAIYTWGWAFGGEFYDSSTRTVTANDPKIIKALEWMSSVASRYGGLTKTNAVYNGMKTGQNLFTGKRVAMGGYGPWEIPQVKKYGPDIDFGVGEMPADAGVKNVTWVGGHKIIIPKGAKHRKEAWRLMKFLFADPEGSAILAKPLDWFPAYKRSNIYDSYKADKNMAPYVRIIQTASHQRPIMPAAQHLWDGLEKAVSVSLLGKKEPSMALQEASVASQKELNRILAKYSPKK